ncbi:MAG: hypothetical protein K2Y08_03335 [Alphaproteobacteria bacterium]|nr:hypothetical protein [Alphaproteobacteria bacterium]
MSKKLIFLLLMSGVILSPIKTYAMDDEKGPSNTLTIRGYKLDATDFKSAAHSQEVNGGIILTSGETILPPPAFAVLLCGDILLPPDTQLSPNSRLQDTTIKFQLKIEIPPEDVVKQLIQRSYQVLPLLKSGTTYLPTYRTDSLYMEEVNYHHPEFSRLRLLGRIE